MDFTSLHTRLLNDFGLRDLPIEEQEDILAEIAKTIQKQFLLDIYDAIGEEKFNALQTSANMGEAFYATTLKHVAPEYEAMFQNSIDKVITAFKKEE